MNDRFKFRVYDYDDNKMHDVIEIMYRKDNTVVEWLNSKDKKRSAFIGEVPTVQCTGLKDKNGKLIYQGDILGDMYEGLYIHYCEHCHQFQLYSQGYGCMACNGDIHWIEVVEDNKKLEVIGNIYENKELLNEI